MLATSGTVTHAPFYMWTCPSTLCRPELVSRPPRCWSEPGLEIGIPIRERAEWGSVMGKRVGLPACCPLTPVQLTLGQAWISRATE